MNQAGFQGSAATAAGLTTFGVTTATTIIPTVVCVTIIPIPRAQVLVHTSEVEYRLYLLQCRKGNSSIKDPTIYFFSTSEQLTKNTIHYFLTALPSLPFNTDEEEEK